jgi:predicted ATPase/class 3 adenylate cyclase
MPDLPSGTVTFLFTDIEGSTALWERDQVAMASAVARHLALLHAATERHGGALFKVVGDAVQAAFPAAPDAVAAALDAQRALMQEAWPERVQPLQIRMALHTAAATPQNGDYLAPGLNRLARLLAAGHGGQVLLSLATQELARDNLPPGSGLSDLGEHPLRDLYRPERVFQLLHPDLPADFPPVRTLATRPNNLPLQPTPFLGREDQVARVADLLSRDDVRLLTITGPGGVGKTRLALQAAADLLEDFPDGVWFVDLSTLDDPSLVPSTIADVLGVRGEGGGIASRLAAMLAGKHLLLVLDNFERVIDAASLVADLLARASGVKVLTTSRTPLRAYGEHEFPLLPFPMPDLSRLPSVETLSQYEAVRLFIQRAQAVKPDFTVNDANAPAVAEICSRLDGLPLAIELAAALVKLLPPQALLKRVEKRLPLLTGGARTLPARQQTMRNTISWSHDLLSQEEQTLFRRLAVFAGGCTLEAAEAVINQEGTHDVFGGIASLVDKSLLRQEEGVEGEPRFRMLETVREFGLERLAASGEEPATRDRHAGYFLALLQGHDLEDARPVWLDGIASEYDNLRAALGWSRDTGHHDTLLRLAGALWLFWYYRGLLSEGQDWLDQALQTPPDNASPRPRAWALTVSGMLANVCGDTDRATALLTESFSWWEQTGEAYGSAIARSLLGGVRVNQGRYDEAAELFAANEDYFRDNEAYFQAAGHEDWLGHASFHLGLIAWVQGDDARARSLLRDAVEHFDRTGAPMDAIDPLRYLGLIASAAGNVDEASGWFREVVTRLRQHGSRAAIAVGLADMATLAAAREAWQPAVRLFAKAKALAQSEAAAFSLPARDHYERAYARATEALGAASSEVAAAGRELALEQALAEAEAVLTLGRDEGASPGP